MSTQHIVIVSTRCPGLSTRLQASVMPNVDRAAVEERIAEAKRIGHFVGMPVEATHIYNELHEAEDYAQRIHSEADRLLAEWRAAVYGEPMPTACA